MRTSTPYSRRIYQRAWRALNQDKLETYEPSEAAKRDAVGRRYLSKYGITLAEYERMFATQGGKCAICERTQEEARLAVDHCHASGKVRELLCRKCNTALGLMREDRYVLQRAIAYLSKHQDAVQIMEIDHS